MGFLDHLLSTQMLYLTLYPETVRLCRGRPLWEDAVDG